MQYKVRISIDGNNFFWVIIENKKIINRNATKEDLINVTTKSRNYNRTNICPICRSENNITDKSILYPKNTLRKIDNKGNKTLEYVCYKHGFKHYNKDWDNIKKLLRYHRTGNLEYDRHILADNCEDLTSKIFGAKRLSIEYDKYSKLPLDHSAIPKGILITIGEKEIDLSGLIPQTKSSSLLCDIWSGYVENEHNKDFDIIIFYCISRDNKKIERIYIIPKKEIMDIERINIHINYPKWYKKDYEKYRVKNEKDINKINEAYHTILSKVR